MAAEVFISYGSADRGRIQELVTRLRGAGVTVWIDEAGIEGAAMWSEEIVSAINNSKVLILAISANSTRSKNVVRELALASEDDKTILPVYIEPTDIPESMKYQLAGIQRVEYFEGNEEESIGSVLRALTRLGISTEDKLRGHELDQTPIAESKTKAKFPALAIVGMAIIALLAILFIFKPNDEKPINESSELAKKATTTQPEARPLEKNRIVILPFKNIGTPGENDHIVEGIVDDLNIMLTNVEGLKVIGSVSAKTYRDSNKTPAEIGQELNAGTLLQGSIQQTGTDLKINVSLIDTTTSENIWANSFSGSESDRSKFQQEIIQSIVNKTRGTLLNQNELGSLNVGDTENSEAYSLVKRGLELLDGFSRNETREAEKFLQKAVKLDPNYADAYYGLAKVENIAPGVSLKEPKDSIPAAKRYLEMALGINPNHIQSIILKLAIKLNQDWDTKNITREIDTLISKNQNSPIVLRELGRIYSFSGRNKKAIAILNQGLALDPKNSWIHANLAFTYFLEGNLRLSEKHNTEAINLRPNLQFALHFRSLILTEQNRHIEIEESLKKAIDNDDKNPVTMMSLGIVYWRAGKKGETYKLLSELLDRRNFEYIKGGILARLYIAMGDKQKAFKWLKKSREEKDTDFFHMYHWPLFDEVRGDPEFIQMYEDSGLFDYLDGKKVN